MEQPGVLQQEKRHGKNRRRRNEIAAMTSKYPLHQAKQSFVVERFRMVTLVNGVRHMSIKVARDVFLGLPWVQQLINSKETPYKYLTHILINVYGIQASFEDGQHTGFTFVESQNVPSIEETQRSSHVNIRFSNARTSHSTSPLSCSPKPPLQQPKGQHDRWEGGSPKPPLQQPKDQQDRWQGGSPKPPLRQPKGQHDRWQGALPPMHNVVLERRSVAGSIAPSTLHHHVPLKFTKNKSSGSQSDENFADVDTNRSCSSDIGNACERKRKRNSNESDLPFREEKNSPNCENTELRPSLLSPKRRKLGLASDHAQSRGSKTSSSSSLQPTRSSRRTTGNKSKVRTHAEITVDGSESQDVRRSKRLRRKPDALKVAHARVRISYPRPAEPLIYHCDVPDRAICSKVPTQRTNDADDDNDNNQTSRSENHTFLCDEDVPQLWYKCNAPISTFISLFESSNDGDDNAKYLKQNKVFTFNDLRKRLQKVQQNNDIFMPPDKDLQKRLVYQYRDFPIVTLKFNYKLQYESMGLKEMHRQGTDFEKTLYAFNKLYPVSVRHKNHDCEQFEDQLKLNEAEFAIMRMDENVIGWKPPNVSGSMNSSWVLFTSGGRNVGRHIDAPAEPLVPLGDHGDDNQDGQRRYSKDAQFETTILGTLVGEADIKLWRRNCPCGTGNECRCPPSWYHRVRLRPGVGVVVLPGQYHEVEPITDYAVKVCTTLVGAALKGRVPPERALHTSLDVDTHKEAMLKAAAEESTQKKGISTSKSTRKQRAKKSMAKK